MGSHWQTAIGLRNLGAAHTTDLKASEKMEGEGRNRLKEKNAGRRGERMSNVIICKTEITI